MFFSQRCPHNKINNVFYISPLQFIASMLEYFSGLKPCARFQVTPTFYLAHGDKK